MFKAIMENIAGVMAVLAVAVAMALRMAEITDTTSKTITGKDGTADIEVTIAGDVHHLKCHMDMFRLREGVEMTTADTFCIEGTADQEPGRAQLAYEMSGLAKKDGPTSLIMFPISAAAVQGALMKFTVSTGCFISGNFNSTESDLVRIVNQNGRIALRGISKPGYVYTWDRTGV